MVEVGERSSRSCDRGGGGRQRAQSRSPHRRGRTRTSAMAYRTLLVLAALVAFVATAHSETAQPRLIDFNPWSWLPTTRNRSPSIMDYFFPPSRTPKQSNLEPPHDREPPRTTVSRPTTGDETPAHTTVEARTVNPTRKATATPIKNKSTSATRSSDSTVIAAATSTLKTKKPAQRISASPETTANFEITKAMKIETSTDGTTISARTASEPSTSTPRPTKHYTIHPVRAAERTTSTDAETTYDTKSTEVDDDTAGEGVTGTTSAEFKETSPTLNTATAAESRATSDDAGTGATTQPADASTEPADGREGYLPLRDRPAQTHVKINEQTKKETVPLPAGSTSVLAKPTKYHYYPHNQHIYLLPECAIQQVCNAVYVRLNYTQPLCACPSRYRDPCSASLNADDLHTTRLTTDSKKRYAHKAVTLVKTCETVSEMRECRAPRDWSLLALQNIRTGKSHYLVICRCSENHILEGPMSHDQPTYASVPGIRVYGMMCVRPAPYPTSGYNANRYTAVTIQSTTSPYKIDYSQPHYNPEKPIYSRFPSHNYAGSSFYNRMSRVARVRRSAYHSSKDNPPFPWYKVREFARTLQWID